MTNNNNLIPQDPFQAIDKITPIAKQIGQKLGNKLNDWIDALIPPTK